MCSVSWDCQQAEGSQGGTISPPRTNPRRSYVHPVRPTEVYIRLHGPEALDPGDNNMRPSSRLTSLIALAAGMALFAAACSAAATPTPVATVAGATATVAVASTAASPAAVDTSSAATGLTLGSTSDPSLGDYLTGPSGMTLYVLTKDTPDVSTCSGSCATTWPPLTTSAGATITGPTGASGAFATITRSDGTVQVTYNHLPLYYYSGDSGTGDTNGQGLNSVWFVAPLSGSIPSAAGGY